MDDWDLLWKWLLDHHIYNAVVLAFVIGYALNAFFKRTGIKAALGKFLGGYKKIKFGKAGVELEAKDGDSEKDVQQDNVLSEIKVELKSINTRLDKHDKYIKAAAIQAGNSVVWSDVGAPYVETINAGLLNANLGANGNLRERMVEVIRGSGEEGRKIYNSLKTKFISDAQETKTELSKAFFDTIVWIESRLA